MFEILAGATLGEGAALVGTGGVVMAVLSLLVKHGAKLVIGKDPDGGDGKPAGNGNGKGLTPKVCPAHEEFSEKLDERHEALQAALSFGTMAAQNANNVNISGGAIAGITDLAVADGGTGASTAAGARANLGIPTLIEDSPTAKTADYTIQASDSGKHFTNTGATGAVVLTLPPATVGLRYAVTRTVSQSFDLKPANGEKFATRATNEYFALGGDNCHIEVKCLVKGVWHIMAQWGAYVWV